MAQAKDTAAGGKEEGLHMTSSPGLKQLVVDWGSGTSIYSIMDGPWPLAWLWALGSASGRSPYWSWMAHLGQEARALIVLWKT